MSNLTFSSSLPPLPKYYLTPAPPLIKIIPDAWLPALLPAAAYWSWGLMFHYFDAHNWFEKYRIHTPAEFKKRNFVPMWDVITCVLKQQILGLAIAIVLDSGPQLQGKEEFGIAVWAMRVRLAQRPVPSILGALGVDSLTSAQSLAPFAPSFASLIQGGGIYLDFSTAVEPTFLRWELFVAEIIYHAVVPAFQFSIAIFVGDSWQFWCHYLGHKFPYWYNNFHSVHHQNYCPYAFGAFYATLSEAFVMDTVGTMLSIWVSGLTNRQTICFATLSTLKSADDHCGYSLPFDPFQCINNQNAAYHDIHHQTWGMKTNFAQVYGTWWDKILGTEWTAEDSVIRYERGRLAAERTFKREEVKSSEKMDPNADLS